VRWLRRPLLIASGPGAALGVAYHPTAPAAVALAREAAGLLGSRAAGAAKPPDEARRPGQPCAAGRPAVPDNQVCLAPQDVVGDARQGSLQGVGPVRACVALLKVQVTRGRLA
jgi:hypothetical protein